MKFSIATLLAAAATAAANSVTFISQDNTHRIVVFTPSPGHAEVPDAQVAGGSTVKVDMPQGWEGNWWSYSDGKSREPGMLGEVIFEAWNGLTFFDVSAIVKPDDHDGVYELYPAQSQQPVSGCKVFPCNNAYYVWDDVQTKSTTETDLICTLGRAQ